MGLLYNPETEQPPAQPKMAHYMKGVIFSMAYEDIIGQEYLERLIDNFWSNLLYTYFPPKNGFGIFPWRQMGSPEGRKSHLTVAHITADGSKTLIVFENRKPQEGDSATPEEWASASETLFANIQATRESTQQSNTIYGAVTIGTHVRFYVAQPEAAALEDLPSAETGKAYELKDDEREIHKILTKFKDEALT
ncbi:hypothetical protein N7468_001819 [Penicillium chermesinum]|uniref:Uncharacterized protein n=1 Tax=Penicillium chermesinum TaxID=63820 RepID=A0A9W9PJ01_9EURO|nr:uncharacterized protein N7468_001819 [Penicillium chermesinum]KAJ5246836.1 hypothetical protein N7468_001819 [Penicillium chermesinum]KAJ6145095.1 hypothetical protein N7470_008990 [Penicillium chermesinum]